MAIHPDDVKAFLNKKVAGIPVYVFALLVSVVLLFLAVRSKKSAATDTATPTPDTAPSGDGSGPDGTQQPDFSASPSDGSGGGSTPMVTADTNALWRQRCISWLIAKPQNVPLDLATSAISKYLNSEPLSSQEVTVRDEAITQFGLPPEGVPDAPDTTDTQTGIDPTIPLATDNPPPLDQTNPPENVQPSPTSVATPISQLPPTKQGVPPCVHTVRNAYDNSAAELAHLYFGESSNDTVNKIHEVNVNTVGGPGGPWAPGTKVNIPSHIQPTYYSATGATNTKPAIAGKNGISPAELQELNPNMNFPVKVGTKVRVK